LSERPNNRSATKVQSSTIDQAHTLNTIEPIRERKYKFQTDYLYFIEGRE